jgi:hypothetical protein
MTFQLHLPPEIENELRRRAIAVGENLETFVLRTVQQSLAVGEPRDRTGVLTGKAWEQEFADWVASHKPIDHFVDDSRESIYDGRGE